MDNNVLAMGVTADMPCRWVAPALSRIRRGHAVKLLLIVPETITDMNDMENLNHKEKTRAGTTISAATVKWFGKERVLVVQGG